MAQESTLGIKITIKGADQAVGSISQLKQALQVARKELEELDRSSDEFKNLQKQVKVADAAVKEFNKSTDGITIEQKAKQFGKFAQGVTSSFAAASAAVNLFGGDTERVSQAAADAQNLLTIAISARGIAEGATAVRTIALNVATRASIVLTQSLTKSFKQLYAVIVANPLTAFLAILGATIAAIALLTQRQSENEKQAKEAAKAQLAYAEAVKTAGLAAGITAKQVGFLINEIRQGNITLSEAEPLLRKYISGLENINLETQEGLDTFNRYITALSNASVVQDKLNAKQTELAEAIKNGNTARQKAIRDEITTLTIELARQQKIINDIENQNKEIGRKNQERLEAQKKAQEALKKRLEELLALKKAELIAEQELTRAELLRYSKGQQAGKLDIEENLKVRLKLIDENINKIRKQETIQQKLNNSTRVFTRQDLKTFKELGINLDIAVGDLDKVFGKAEDVQKKYLENKGIIERAVMESPKELPVIKNINDLRKVLEKFKEDYSGVIEELLSPEILKQINDEQTKLATNITLVETGFIRAGENVPENFGKVVKAIQDIDDGVAVTYEELQKAQADFDEARKNYVENYIRQNTTLSKSDELYQVQQEELRKTGDAYFNQIVQNQGNVNDYEQSLTNITSTIVKLVDAQNKYIQSGGAITDFIRDNRGEIVSQIDLQLNSFKDTLKTIEDIDTALRKKASTFLEVNFVTDGRLAEQVLQFEKELAQQGIDISKAEYEEKLRLLREYLVKKKTEETQGLADFNKKILDSVQQFQNALTAISQVTQDSFRFQLQIAEEDYERAQNNIVGETEEANKKRLEAETIYQNKKKEIEKQAAKVSLQIALAQAIANAAAALVKITEQTGILSVIAGTAIAAANFASISQISQQLNRLDTYDRGGMIYGPSHEYGGVKYAQGGVELEGGEAVINRASSVRYAGLLSEINQAGGGKPIVMNNFDDSRIVEALAKQRKEPLRAYVVEQDITRAQTVNKRLESLAQI